MHDPPNLKRFDAKMAAVTTDACPKANTAETAGVAESKEVLL